MLLSSFGTTSWSALPVHSCFTGGTHAHCVGVIFPKQVLFMQNSKKSSFYASVWQNRIPVTPAPIVLGLVQHRKLMVRERNV
jgi:hypothetical protein